MEEVLQQNTGEPILGDQILPALLTIGPNGSTFIGEVLVLAAVVEVDAAGNPSRRLNKESTLPGEGDVLAVSCLPFLDTGPRFELSII